MDYVLYSGTCSLAPEGAHPRHGDPALVRSFERPDSAIWSEENWFCAQLRVDQYSDVRLTVAFLDETGRELRIALETLPNVTVNFRVRLDELWNKRFFLPVFPGSYKVHCQGLPMDPQSVRRIEIRVAPGKDFERATLSRVWLSSEEPGGVTPDAPIVDELGQLIGHEWTTKTHSFEEMKERLEAEYREACEHDHPFPNRSRWGGFLEKRFEATGWFRVQQEGDRWWMVDPDGYAFFSHGMCYGTRMGEFGWYTGMEAFYENAPSPDDPAYKNAFTHPGLIAEYVKRHGVTNRSNDWMYNPARGNMIRIFGDNWWEAWRAIATHRFHEWGINTTGVGIVNFIDERCEDFLRLSNMPYAVTLKRFPTTKHFIFRDFPDVFSPEYAENARVFAENELSPHKDNRNMIGYFLHNEPEWMFQLDCNIAWELLVKNEPLESRAHLKNWLASRYGTVEALCAAWGVELASFDRLLEPLPRETVLSEKGWEDLREYEQVLIDGFGGIPLTACRRVSPHHLCMGMRYANLNEKVLMSCRIFDVLSFNCYSHHPEDSLALGHRANKPLLIGEWHFGGPDNGLLRTALLSAASQQERGKAYRRYLETCAADKCCVGAHYFEYNNQTLMGRFDGEHMAHGIIDCCNLPYPHMVEAMKTCSRNLYALMTGEKAPYDEPIEYQKEVW